MDGDLSVNKLIFLSRDSLSQKTGAHLISSGPWGMIHFWNIFYNEMFMWETFTNRILPADAHKKCSGRLHVSLTSAKNGKNLIVNKFNSKEDLIQVSLFIY